MVRGHGTQIAAVLLVTGGVAFLANMILFGVLDGSALNGDVEAGHYYVRRGVDLNEVSQLAWSASLVLGLALLISWPLAIASMGYLLFRHVFPLLTSGRAPGREQERIAEILSSGSPLWAGSPGGAVGDLWGSMGMLSVAVYPGGIVGRVRFMQPFAIRSTESRDVRFGRRLVTSTIQVDHAGIDVTSPLILYGAPDSTQAAAIQSLLDARTRPVIEDPTTPSPADT